MLIIKTEFNINCQIHIIDIVKLNHSRRGSNRTADGVIVDVSSIGLVGIFFKPNFTVYLIFNWNEMLANYIDVSRP